MISELLDHNSGSSTDHMGGGSIWTILSMLALSLFLLAFAWSLLRPRREPASTAADIATERYAHGKIDVEAFERILSDIESQRRRRNGPGDPFLRRSGG